MKTLQEQYTLIQEGKGHKDMFLKSAHRLFPEYITNFASYGEATTILKQKGILNEVFVGGGVVTQRTFNPFKAWDAFLNEASVQENPIKALEEKILARKIKQTKSIFSYFCRILNFLHFGNHILAAHYHKFG